ncbi:MAG: hypothetical protein IV108_01030 [Burkholderiales bacterium]|nr:hypothetical protein [Burkholderiales bacterium]
MDTPNDIPPWRIFPKQIEAACYNRVRLALLRIENPLRIALARHRGLEVILHDDHWLCVDSFAEDQWVMAWREFQIHARDNLVEPIACNLWLYHHCASLITGSALDDLHQVVAQQLGSNEGKSCR